MRSFENSTPHSGGDLFGRRSRSVVSDGETRPLCQTRTGESLGQRCRNGRGRPKELIINVTKEFQYSPKGFPLGLAAGQTQLRRFSPAPPLNFKKAPPVDGGIEYVAIPLGNVEEERISVAMVNRQQL